MYIHIYIHIDMCIYIYYYIYILLYIYYYIYILYVYIYIYIYNIHVYIYISIYIYIFIHIYEICALWRWYMLWWILFRGGNQSICVHQAQAGEHCDPSSTVPPGMLTNAQKPGGLLTQKWIQLESILGPTLNVAGGLTYLSILKANLA
jgi:hypothetical protein